MTDCTLCRYSIPHFFTDKKTGKVTVGLHNADGGVTVENVPFNFGPECGKVLKQEEKEANADAEHSNS